MSAVCEVPSIAQAWFKFDDIADIEKESLPEFFNGAYVGKTQEAYKEYRNFMVKLYRESP